jgi:hypothetical protein
MKATTLKTLGMTFALAGLAGCMSEADMQERAKPAPHALDMTQPVDQAVLTAFQAGATTIRLNPQKSTLETCKRIVMDAPVDAHISCLNNGEYIAGFGRDGDVISPP